MSRDREATEDKRFVITRTLDSQQRVGVGEAVVVERGQDGQLVEKDRIESTSLPATASGGLIGLLLGVFAGPLGVVSHRPAERFRRHGGRSPHDGEREVALEDISRNLEPGVTLVVAEIAEPDPDVLDSLASLDLHHRLWSRALSRREHHRRPGDMPSRDSGDSHRGPSYTITLIGW